jgi:soluble P-type ATPase
LEAIGIPAGGEAQAKGEYTRKLGSEHVLALDQGADDVEMLREAALEICVLGPEGKAVEALMAADVVAPSVPDGLDLPYKPRRLVATLRR